jgi:tetratricopeptide (TPR) repeat protein
MPNSARILKFPTRSSRERLSGEGARAAAQHLLEQPTSERSDDALLQPDVLMSVLALISEQKDTAPKAVLEEATYVYNVLKASEAPIGVFDERDYFLGEAAYLAGVASRLVGRRDESIRWLDRAEAKFRHTINCTPNLTNVAYARLGLAYEVGRYDDVLELVPSVLASFERLKMRNEVAKCLLLEAMALKATGKPQEAMEVLQPVRSWASGTISSGLQGRILSEIGDLLQVDDRFDEAMSAYAEALAAFGDSGLSQARADLKVFVAEAHRARKQPAVALEGFRAAIADYQELGLETRVAYLRLFISEVLLQLGRPREAEWELLAALPTIEEQKMVPEGFAAVALLKESVRRRKTDPNALRELREHLQATNQK